MKTRHPFKIIIPILLSCLVSLAMPIEVAAQQTNNLPALPGPVFGGTLGSALTSVWEGLTSINLKDGVSVGAFGLKHGGDYGGGLLIEANSTNHVTAFFAVAAVSEKDAVTGKRKFQFYDATGGLSFQGTMKIPLIGDAVLFSDNGPALNLHDVHTVYFQNINGARKAWDIGGGHLLSVGVFAGYMSAWSGIFYGVDASYSVKF